MSTRNRRRICAWSAMRADPSHAIGIDRTTGAAPLAVRRRELLRRAALLGAWLGCGMAGSRAMAAAAADPLFAATSMTDVLRAMGSAPLQSRLIELELPELSENGALVPVSVTSRLPRTTRIALLAEANPYPLVVRFDIAPGTEPYVSTRVKLAQSCSVSAIVTADGRLYATQRSTAVTQGGCGG